MKKTISSILVAFVLLMTLMGGCTFSATPTPITVDNVDDIVVIKTIEAASEGITSLALSPGGDILAYGTYADNAVHLVNVSSGEETMVLEGHTNAVSSLAFSPDGKLLASTGTVNLSPEDGSMRIWDAQTGEELANFETNGVRQLSFSPDGSILAGAGGGGDHLLVRLWDVKTLTEKTSIENVFNNLSFSPDGTLLAAGSRDQLVHIMDVTTGSETKTLDGHTGWISALAYSSSGQMLASGSDDTTIRLWDASTGAKGRSLTGSESEVGLLAFSPDGSVLASLGTGINISRDSGQITFSLGAGDKNIRLWDVETGEQIKLIETDEGISTAAFDANWTLIATGDEKGVIQIWGLK